MIEKEPIVNTYISVPKDKGSLNCASFIAGIVEAILEVSAFILCLRPFIELIFSNILLDVFYYLLKIEWIVEVEKKEDGEGGGIRGGIAYRSFLP